MERDLSPQLLNPISPEEADPYLADDAWWVQPKYDGKRIVLRVQGGHAVAFNRRTLPCRVPNEVARAAEKLAGELDVTLDGELVKNRLYVWDVLAMSGHDCRPAPYQKRLELLEALMKRAPVEVVLATTARTTAEKRALTAQLEADRAEGFVLKRHGAAYRAGRPGSGGDQLKVKFWDSASVLVAGPNGTKHSVCVAVLNEAGEPVSVGHVTVKPEMSPTMPVGTILEVKYLYVGAGGHLVQPSCIGIRDDLTPDDCTAAQLKHKAEEE